MFDPKRAQNVGCTRVLVPSTAQRSKLTGEVATQSLELGALGLAVHARMHMHLMMGSRYCCRQCTKPSTGAAGMCSSLTPEEKFATKACLHKPQPRYATDRKRKDPEPSSKLKLEQSRTLASDRMRGTLQNTGH